MSKVFVITINVGIRVELMREESAKAAEQLNTQQWSDKIRTGSVATSQRIHFKWLGRTA